jgi:hypothetical protein
MFWEEKIWKTYWQLLWIRTKKINEYVEYVRICRRFERMAHNNNVMILWETLLAGGTRSWWLNLHSWLGCPASNTESTRKRTYRHWDWRPTRTFPYRPWQVCQLRHSPIDIENRKCTHIRTLKRKKHLTTGPHSLSIALTCRYEVSLFQFPA